MSESIIICRKCGGEIRGWGKGLRCWTCGDSSFENQIKLDGNPPKVSEPWCPKCFEHTETEKETKSSGDHGFSEVVYHCNVCGSSCFIPSKFRNVWRGPFSKLMGFGFLGYMITSLVYSIESYMLVGSLVMFLGLWFVYVGRPLILYRKWKNWSKERIQEEEKT